MPAAPTRPVPSRMRLLGSGACAAAAVNSKAVTSVVELVSLKVPKVGVYPVSKNVPVPIRSRNVGRKGLAKVALDRTKLSVAGVGKILDVEKRVTPFDAVGVAKLKLPSETNGPKPVMVPVLPNMIPVVGLKVIEVESNESEPATEIAPEMGVACAIVAVATSIAQRVSNCFNFVIDPPEYWPHGAGCFYAR
jgi:hypothetical protein